MPYHKQLDELEEAARGERAQGTTKRGIGPCYTDKVGRVGLRMGDLLDPTFLRDELPYVVAQKNRVLTRLYEAPPIELGALAATCHDWAERLRPLITDTLPLVCAPALRSGERVILEGQLGVMRDLDWGIYPYVTSSSALAGGAAGGAGIPPRAIDEVLGVLKAYTTSVGEGPFPTELHDESGGAPGADRARVRGGNRAATALRLVRRRGRALRRGGERLLVARAAQAGRAGRLPHAAALHRLPAGWPALRRAGPPRAGWPAWSRYTKWCRGGRRRLCRSGASMTCRRRPAGTYCG